MFLEDAFSLEGATELKKRVDAYWAERSDEFYTPYVKVVPVTAPSLYGQKHKRWTITSDMINGQPQRKTHKDVTPAHTP